MEKVFESIEHAREEFEVFRKAPNFSNDDAELLILRITDLLGWYRISHEEELGELIEAMINFGEKKRWSMAGARVQFNHLRQAKRQNNQHTKEMKA